MIKKAYRRRVRYLILCKPASKQHLSQLAAVLRYRMSESQFEKVGLRPGSCKGLNYLVVRRQYAQLVRVLTNGLSVETVVIKHSLTI